MAMDTDTLELLDDLLARDPVDTVAQLKAKLPDWHVTSCDASDMGSEPVFRRRPTGDLYLVDRTNHCWSITADPAAATGLLWAKRRPR